MGVNKKSLSETDICTQFITPAIQQAGWDFPTQVRQEHSFTAGQIIVKGKVVKRGKGKRADYILYYRPNLPIAVVEAKDNNKPVGGGMQQALGYAADDALAVPFAFSSNGDAFLFHDKTGNGPVVEQEFPLDQFPSPDDLWRRYCESKGLTTHAEENCHSRTYSCVFGQLVSKSRKDFGAEHRGLTSEITRKTHIQA